MTNPEQAHRMVTSNDAFDTVELNGMMGLAEVVSSDGTEVFWVLDPQAGDRPPGCACSECAPHDQ
jgi:hypothetical protein